MRVWDKKRICIEQKWKIAYYSKLNEKDVTDNKMFWKIVRPFFSDKVISSEKITLIEEDENIWNDSDTQHVF